jgi:hypothetical protein
VFGAIGRNSRRLRINGTVFAPFARVMNMIDREVQSKDEEQKDDDRDERGEFDSEYNLPFTD